ncbi:MAG: acyl-ACP--UDP-N-acetylglucosamine O-acyltransferase [Hyphomicrobiales bacterium]|nr:acyl-ACP--UDP-N-acetylglucosamine O-acyltransferase [Alphaproteobacteria bacterium]
MPQIDPSSRVADGAKLANDVQIGPFCAVGPDVELRAGVWLLSHVNVTGVTVIGEQTVVHPFASLGGPPQSTGYRGGATRLTVGRNCQIREGVTISTGTEDHGELTTVGDRCFLMANSHVGHDCRVGNEVIFANNAVLGGHVSVGDNVFLGGNSAVHQFVRIGEGAMIGGMSGIGKDIIPFGFAFGTRAALVGLNVVGLKRRKYTRADLHRIREAYQMLFFGDDTFAKRVERASTAFSGDPVVGKIVAFIREGGKRSPMTPAIEGGTGDPDNAP